MIMRKDLQGEHYLAAKIHSHGGQNCNYTIRSDRLTQTVPIFHGKSKLEIQAQNEKSKSKLKIEAQNRNSKSKLKIETQNQNSKSKLKIETQNRNSKSKIRPDLKHWLKLLSRSSCRYILFLQRQEKQRHNLRSISSPLNNLPSGRTHDAKTLLFQVGPPFGPQIRQFWICQSWKKAEKHNDEKYNIHIFFSRLEN